MRYIGLITTGRLTVLLFIASCEMDCAVLTIFKPMLQTDLKNIFIENVPILEIPSAELPFLFLFNWILKMTTFSWAPVVYFFNKIVGVASFCGIFNFHAPAILRVIARSFF